MWWRTCGAVSLLAAASAQAPAAPAAPVALGAELAAAVDLPDAAARRQRAAALAKRAVPLADWLAACREFGRFEKLEAGPNHHRVELQVLGVAETTDVYLYVPASYDPAKPAPLLHWAHGAGGSGAREHLHWQQTAEQLGMPVLAPTEFAKEPGYSFTARERAAQLAALRWARRRANIDEDAIFLGGASRGGHLTWDVALRFPDRFAGLVPCIGGPRLQVQKGQNNMRLLPNLLDVPIRDLQGSQDDPYLLANLRLAFKLLERDRAADAKLIEFKDQGHSFDLAAVDWTQFFALRRRPVPPRVVRLTASPDEARAFYAEMLQLDARVEIEPVLQVDPAAYNKLDEMAQRSYLLDKVIAKTARLEVQMLAPGRFKASGKLVAKFRLLLTAEMIGDGGQVEVQWQGRTLRKKVAPSAAVLLAEFVERFDRRFLPVAEIVVP